MNATERKRKHWSIYAGWTAMILAIVVLPLDIMIRMNLVGVHPFQVVINGGILVLLWLALRRIERAPSVAWGIAAVIVACIMIAGLVFLSRLFA